MGPLKGFRVIELAGIGPTPFGAMMLADMGAEVITIERAAGIAGLRPQDATLRNRRSIVVNLKKPEGVALVLKLCESADALIEGFRPGVAERLGLGPEVVQTRNPKLVYARMTGWGQSGPLAQTVGHDINYIAITGALEKMGRDAGRPVPPLNLVGDFGGGGLFMAYGVVCALLEAQKSGKGQVVDAAIVDGAATLMAYLYAYEKIRFLYLSKIAVRICLVAATIFTTPLSVQMENLFLLVHWRRIFISTLLSASAWIKQNSNINGWARRSKTSAKFLHSKQKLLRYSKQKHALNG